VLNDEPGEKCNGVINRTYTKQHNYGISGQATLLGSVKGLHSQLTVGAGHDRSNVDFLQTAQLGYITPDLNVTGLNAFADGSNAGTINGEPLDSRVNLRGLIHTSSLFATDSLQVNKALTLTFSGRFNHTVVDNFDHIVPGGKGSLTGRYTFDRFNPAVGITFSPNAAIGLYGSYSEGSRAPTAIELGCADPEQPCKLPNSLAGDPALSQVVARTLEAGVRSHAESRVAWSVGWFLGQNSNDILFVSSSSTGLGYFRNFGKTRRQGAEVSLRSRIRRVTMGGSYTFLDATFQSPEIVNGSGNSTNSLALQGIRGLEGTIQIRAGNRIPLIPSNMIKAWADLQATSKLALDVDFRAAGMTYARGNENNLSQPDGTYYLGPGTSPGYGVTSLGARYQVLRRLQLFVQVSNAFNHRYYTGAQLGRTAFTATGNFAARPLPAINGEFPIPQSTFYAPGSPRNFLGGLKLTF
jgi:outer membrane receptor protein involved in Fe transport